MFIYIKNKNKARIVYKRMYIYIYIHTYIHIRMVYRYMYINVIGRGLVDPKRQGFSAHASFALNLERRLGE